MLLDENALHLSGCKEAGERCENGGDCCFGLECPNQLLPRCRHQPRQLGEPCGPDNKCADPYHCGGIGGDGEQVCRELNEGEEGEYCGNVFVDLQKGEMATLAIVNLSMVLSLCNVVALTTRRLGHFFFFFFFLSAATFFPPPLFVAVFPL